MDFIGLNTVWKFKNNFFFLLAIVVLQQEPAQETPAREAEVGRRQLQLPKEGLEQPLLGTEYHSADRSAGVQFD
jgi:hypothetical protein